MGWVTGFPAAEVIQRAAPDSAQTGLSITGSLFQKDSGKVAVGPLVSPWSESAC